MKKIIIIIALLILLANPIFANFKISGRVYNYDGSTPKIANITIHLDDDEKAVVEQDENGYFSYDLKDKTPLISIDFSAPNHFVYSQQFILPEDKDSLFIAVKLMPFYNLNDIKEIYIFGNFNNYETQKLEKMSKNSDGTYSFSVDYASDTIIYQIYPQFNNFEGIHTFNGTQSDFYIYDNGGDYYSAIIDKSRKFNIKYDPNNYPKGDYKVDFQFNDIEYTNNSKSYFAACKKFDEYLYDRSMIILNRENSPEEITKLSLEAKKKYLDFIDNIIRGIENQDFRRLSIFQYLEVASDGQYIDDGLMEFANKDLLKEINSIDPNSKIWNYSHHTRLLAFSEILLGNLENTEYMDKVLNSNINDDKKAVILSVLTRHCYQTGNTELGDKFYNRLQSDYPETDYARTLFNTYDKNKLIKVGKQLPDFSLQNLDNENENITPQSLKGKYVLIDVWGTWCAPCLMELPYLTSAYAKYKDKNFTIFSIAIDGSADIVRKFREKKKKVSWLSDEEQLDSNLPWIHSYGGSWKSDIVKTLEVSGVPKAILIDPDGKIIDIDNLRGDNLDKTLSKYLSE